MIDVLDIEKRSYTDPWSEEDFLRVLRQRNCIGMVAEQNNRVIGYMIYELHRNKIQVLNFVVHSNFRRIGVGTQLIEKLVAKLSSHRRNQITFIINELNLETVGVFLRKLGFGAHSIMRDYFEVIDSETEEVTVRDGILMNYYLEGSDE